MRHVPAREAKATFAALVRAAQEGEPTTITQHGEPAAVVVSVADAARLYAGSPANLAEHLLAFPGMDLIERDRTPVRDVDL